MNHRFHNSPLFSKSCRDKVYIILSRQDSKNGEGVVGSNNAPSSEAAAKEVTEANSGKLGSGKPGSDQSSAKAAASANQATRSFEEFEIGAVRETEGQIEIKRSKEPGELPSSTSQTSEQATNSNTQNPDENAQNSSPMNQEPFKGSGSVDYGKDVPFGL